jgi:hypothetical protein
MNPINYFLLPPEPPRLEYQILLICTDVMWYFDCVHGEPLSSQGPYSNR